MCRYEEGVTTSFDIISSYLDIASFLVPRLSSLCTLHRISLIILSLPIARTAHSIYIFTILRANIQYITLLHYLLRHIPI